MPDEPDKHLAYHRAARDRATAQAKVTPIDLYSSHRQEADGSHTVMLTISGLPSMEWANRVSLWIRSAIREHANEIGLLDAEPPQSQ